MSWRILSGNSREIFHEFENAACLGIVFLKGVSDLGLGRACQHGTLAISSCPIRRQSLGRMALLGNVPTGFGQPYHRVARTP